MAKRKAKTASRTTTKTKAAKKPASRRTRRKAAPSGPDGSLRKWWAALDESRRRGIVSATLRSSLLTAFLAVVAVGMHLLNGYVFAQPAFAQSTATVELTDRPAWMNDQLAWRITDELTRRQGEDLRTFDPQAARRVHEAARQCLWIRQIDDVRVERVAANGDLGLYGGGRVRVRAEYRRPAAVISGFGSEQIVDDQGVVLPLSEALELSWTAGLPRIVGLSRRSPGVGAQWPGQDLTAALALIKLMADKPYFAEISVVDVTNHGRRESLTEPAITMVAVADGRVTEIRFGELPLDGLTPVGEPSLERKLGYLDGWRRRNGGCITGPAYLDLRYGDKVVFPASYVASP